MSIERSIQVVGSTGVPVITIDERGIVDSQSRLETREITCSLVAVPVANYIWTCVAGVWVIQQIDVLVRVTGGTAATLDVLVCQQVEAVASGVTQLLTAVADVEETAPFRLRPALIATPTQIFPGDSVAYNLGGTATGLIGLLQVLVKRVQ